MVEIIWTISALHDLEQIHNYISEDSKFYADRFVKKLVERVSILETLPMAGRMVPEKEDKTIRELIEGNYRIFYKVDKNERIYILRIHHSARNLE